MNIPNNPILQIEHVSHFFKKGKNLQHAVLEDFNLQLLPGEIVGMLGRSGSGKSTLLRIMAGLIVPSTGEVLYKNHPLTQQQNPSLAMIFQNFALFPWMTVLENVELGLLAKHLPRKEIKKRALSGIDLIGLDGYEQAYPRELSGGMQQRVGFARAIVTHPDILLMDEPFSALDVLTAETLRNDFIELWLNRTLPIQSAILVTHNIEESVLMCDRLLIFSTNPGRIISEISVNLPHPRNRNSPSFKQIVEDIYLEMTEHLTFKRFHLPPPKGVAINTVLPLISSNIFSGFLETLAEPPYNGRADLSILSSSLHMEIDDIFPIAESLQAIDLALITHGDVQLTPSGLLFVESDTDQRKKIFAEKLIQHVALARLIVDSLNENNNHAISKKHFLDILRQYMTEKAALRSLQAIITWGRYGEIFAYHDSSETFNLENPN